MIPIILENERIRLRPFNENDIEAIFRIFSNEEINDFLPWYPLKDMDEAYRFFQERYKVSEKEKYRFAICLKEDDQAFGYISVSSSGNYEMGYGLLKEYWGKGYVSDACLLLIKRLKEDGVPYITATHDVNNIKSGSVLVRLGMRYCYSYQEITKPKNQSVTFRMYQLDLNGEHDDYPVFWESNGNKTIEDVE